MSAVMKPGKGRHGKRPADKRYDPHTKAVIVAKFLAGERAWALARTWSIPFPTVYGRCSKARRELARAAAVSSDSDPGEGEEV